MPDSQISTPAPDPSFEAPGGQPEPSAPPQGNLLKKRAIRQGITVAVVILVVVIGAMIARPLYGRLKAFHSRARAAESLQLAAEGKVEAALEKGREAYILSQNEPMATRAVAVALSAHGDAAEALQWWKALLSSQAFAYADRIATADAALRAGQFDEADAQLAVLMAHNPRSAENLRLQARCKLARDDQAGALAAVQQAIELDPGNEEGQMFIAALLFDSKSEHQEGVRRLQGLATLKNQTGLNALMALAADRLASGEENRKVAAALSSHPQAKPINHLEALRLELLCRPAEKKKLLDEAQLRFASASAEFLYEWASFLFGIGENERVVALLPLKRAVLHKEFFKLHLDALAALRRWSNIREVLEGENLPLSKPVVIVLQARCESELGNTIQAHALWDAAIQSAGSDATLLLAMSDYALRMREYQRAQDASDRAAAVAALGTNSSSDLASEEVRRKQLGREFVATDSEIESRQKRLKFTATSDEAKAYKNRSTPSFTASDEEVSARRKESGADITVTEEEVAARKKDLGIGRGE